jgi:hypothetical protein
VHSSTCYCCCARGYARLWGERRDRRLARGSYGHASHVPTFAKLEASSRYIVGLVRAAHYDTVLLSAGTNDTPGRCIELLRNKVHADRLLCIIRVNGARARVLLVAAQHGDFVNLRSKNATECNFFLTRSHPKSDWR